MAPRRTVPCTWRRDGPAPIRHRRLGRRRQVDPHRSAAARLQVDLRGPAGGRRGHLPRPAATTTPTWRCSPTGCAPSASRASPSTSPTATSRRPSPQVHHRRHPGPRPVHPQHGHRRLDRRPRPGARRRPPGPDRAVPPARRAPVAAPGPAPGAGRQQDGPRRLRRRRSTSGSTTSSRQFATKLNIPDLEVIPISALKGDNVVTRSENMPWYHGPTLMHHLEHVHVASDRDLVDIRFPVQYVVRPEVRRATTTTAATPARSPAAS